jgi:hypothetical protein
MVAEMLLRDEPVARMGHSDVIRFMVSEAG